jgi:hypothetical protein
LVLDDEEEEGDNGESSEDERKGSSGSNPFAALDGDGNDSSDSDLED